MDRTQHEDGQVTQLQLLPDLPGHLEPLVIAGHKHVEDHEVGLLRLNLLDALLGVVSRADLKTVRLQDHSVGLVDVLLVVHDQNLRHHELLSVQPIR